jgi:hypothetical protein
VVIGLGAAAWYYREPLGGFATDLIDTVDTEMARDQAAQDRAAATTGANEPLAEAPAVTDDTPATVLAPGAKEPASAKPAQPETVAPVPEAQPPVTESSGQAPAATTATAPPPDSAPAERAPAPAELAPGTAPQTAPATAPPQLARAAGPTSFSFQQSALTVRESDVAARITIRRTGDLAGTAEVSWWTADGSAVADRDYADLGARIERFAPGEATRTVYVPITNDAIGEPARSFTVLLGRGGDAASEIRVDIVDDD